MTRRSLSAAVLAVAAVLVGWQGDPELTPITIARPGATAELHTNRSNDTRSIRITEGVAIAIECADAKRRPCSFDGTVIEDSSIATFRKAYADLNQKEVQSRGYEQTSHLDRTVFVVVGKTPGRTTLTVRTGYGDVPVIVEVLPAS